MYLSMLDRKKKHLFRDLEIHMANADGEFSDQEKQVIDTHCIEMHIDNNGYESKLPLDDVLLEMSEFSNMEKHIVFLEIAAMVLADEIYHEKEREAIAKISDVLGIDKNEINDAFAIINDMKTVYSRCAVFVGK